MASPLLRWTLGYLVGILLADALRPSLLVVPWLGLGGLLLFLIAVAGRGRPEAALPLIAGVLGLWAGAQSQAPRALGHPEALAAAANEPWVLHGVVREDVRQTATATLIPLSVAALGRLAIASGTTTDQAGLPRFWRSQPPLYVDLFVDGTLHESPLPGDTLRVAAHLRDIAGQRQESPWEVPGAAHGTKLRAYAQADALLRLSTPPSPVQTGDPSGLALRSAPLRLAARARRALTRAHEAAWGRLPGSLQSVEPSSPTLSALQLAMSLGDRGPLQRRDAERGAAGKIPIAAVLRAAGVYHILSVSGLHLSVVGLTCFALCRWMCRWVCPWIFGFWVWPWSWRRTSQRGRSPATAAPTVGQRWAALITLPVILFYALLTGAEPPTVRAAITLFAALLAIACGRRARLSTGLALAALWSSLPLGPDSGPQSLFSPSLVLSFAATLGIAYLRPLASLLPDSLRDAAPAPAGARPGAGRRLWDLGRRALALLLRLCDASLAASLATAPLLAYYFAEFQGGALFGNLLVTPLAEFVLLPCGLLAALVALIHPSLALPLIVLSSLSGRLALALATQVADLGLGCQVAAPGRGVLVLWYLGLCLSPWRRRLGLLLSGAALLIYLLSWLPAWMRPWPLPWLRPGNELRLSFVDAGQGDAAVAELPGGGIVVIDAGWPPHPERAQGDPRRPSVATPGVSLSAGGTSQTPVGQFLRRRGHQRIDLLIISHRHPDHMGGASSLLSQFTVDVLWLNRQPEPQGADARLAPMSAAEADLIRLARARGTLVAVPHSLRLSGIAIDVLSPCPVATPCRATARSDWEENDNSLVVALRYAGRTILMTGDIESAAEQTLLAAGRDLRADVLKLPHHGSRTSSGAAFLRAVAPLHAIASLGRQNRFGFPHPQVVQRLADQHILLWRTDRDGTLQVEIGPDGRLQVSPQRPAPTLLNFLGSRP